MQGSTLHERLDALFAAPLDGDRAPSLEEIESTLTDGYALALALDAERSRLTRRISQLAAEDGIDVHERSRELSSLAQRLGETDAELSRLRRALSEARGRAKEQRLAAALA